MIHTILIYIYQYGIFQHILLTAIVEETDNWLSTHLASKNTLISLCKHENIEYSEYDNHHLIVKESPKYADKFYLFVDTNFSLYNDNGQIIFGIDCDEYKDIIHSQNLFAELREE